MPARKVRAKLRSTTARPAGAWLAAIGTEQPVRPPDAAAHLIDGRTARVAPDRQRAIEPLGMDPAQETGAGRDRNWPASSLRMALSSRSRPWANRQPSRAPSLARRRALGASIPSPSRNAIHRSGPSNRPPACPLNASMRPTRHAVALHVPERFIVQHGLVEGAAHRVEEAQTALRPRRSEPAEAIVADRDAIAVAALMARAGVRRPRARPPPSRPRLQDLPAASPTNGSLFPVSMRRT